MRIDISYGTHVINTFDDLNGAREEAQGRADRDRVTLYLVNATPGEPRYLLETIEPANAPTDDGGVWLKFDADDDETPSHEANVWATDDGRFRVEWENTDVGQVTSVMFDTREAAHEWLTSGGYTDFTAGGR